MHEFGSLSAQPLDFKIEAMWKEDSMRTETKGLDSSIEHALSLLHDSPTSSSSSSSGHHRHHQGHHHLRRHYDDHRHHRSSHTPNCRRCGKRLHGVSVLRPLLRRGERAHWTLQNEVLLSNFALLSKSTFLSYVGMSTSPPTMKSRRRRRWGGNGWPRQRQKQCDFTLLQEVLKSHLPNWYSDIIFPSWNWFIRKIIWFRKLTETLQIQTGNSITVVSE